MATEDINLDELANFEPMITNEQMEHLENIATSQGIGQGRRLVHLALARGADDISNMSIEEPDAFTEMLETMEGYQRHVRHLSEMTESALLRMQIADCRNA